MSKAGVGTTMRGFKDAVMGGSKKMYDDSYDDGFNSVVSKQATNPNKNSLHNTLECAYCSDMVCNLTHYDVSDMYKEEEPSYMWMCDDCVTIEEGYKKVEKDYYKDSSKAVAVIEVGKS